MALPAQHSLLYILLLWITVISIIQAVFIILFFTQGHINLVQDGVTESTPLKHSHIHSTPSIACEDRLQPGSGRMLTFKAAGSNSKIRWFPKNNECLIREKHETTTLTIGKGGYYFLNLQVTLSKGEGSTARHTVRLSRSGRVILEGWIHTNTISTGSLSKVEKMSTGESLEVTISPWSEHVNQSESVTHLDIVYLPLAAL